MAIENGAHRAYIMDRGGRRRIGKGEVTGLGLVRWGRVRDGISEAKVQVEVGRDRNQAAFLASIEPHRHELCIYRNDERVWEGPITLAAFQRGRFTVDAKDVGHYLARTVIRTADSSAFPNNESAIQRIDRIIRREMNRAWEIADPPANVIPFLTLHETLQDARTSSSVLPFQMTVHELMDGMAWRGGIDYVTVGRAIHLLDVNNSLGQTRTLTRANFLAEPIVSRYGMEQASIAIATDGQGRAGIALAAAESADFYGPWEILNTAYDEDSGELPPSVEELTSQAERNLGGRARTPVVVRIPDNTGLDLRGSLTVADLVPAVNMPLRLQYLGGEIVQMQRLQSVTFEETEAGESIKVTLYPAASPDAVEV